MNAAIILARTDSSRFPNKAFTSIGRKMLIERVLEKVIEIQDTFLPILATTNRKIDDGLIDIAKRYGISTFRGDTNNVAARVVSCLDYYDITRFARINGDSPFLYKNLLVDALTILKERDLDFVTNIYPRSFPYGVSAEVFRSKTFKTAYSSFSTNAHYCEHITSYFYDNISCYDFFNIRNKEDVNEISLTVDTYQDKVKLELLIEKCPEIFEKTLNEVTNVYKENVK